MVFMPDPAEHYVFELSVRLRRGALTSLIFAHINYYQLYVFLVVCPSVHHKIHFVHIISIMFSGCLYICHKSISIWHESTLAGGACSFRLAVGI